MKSVFFFAIAFVAAPCALLAGSLAIGSLFLIGFKDTRTHALSVRESLLMFTILATMTLFFALIARYASRGYRRCRRDKSELQRGFPVEPIQ